MKKALLKRTLELNFRAYENLAIERGLGKIMPELSGQELSHLDIADLECLIRHAQEVLRTPST